MRKINPNVKYRFVLVTKALAFIMLAFVFYVCVCSIQSSHEALAVLAVLTSALICWLMFRERDAYYFVHFISYGKNGRIYLRFPERVSISEIEKKIASLNDGNSVTVINYMMISRREYELNLPENETLPS